MPTNENVTRIYFSIASFYSDISKKYMREPLFDKFTHRQDCSFIRENTTQPFPCKICEIFQNFCFAEHLDNSTSTFNSTFLLFLDYLVCLKTNQYQFNSPG